MPVKWIAFLMMSLCLVSGADAATNLSQYRDIVVSENAPVPVKSAAQDLKYHLDKIAGRDLPLVSGKAGMSPEGLHFYVGSGFWPDQDARAAKLDREGWLLASVPNGLLISGSNEAVARFAGVEDAVSLFLEEHCGVRWLWPGPTGEVIPKNPDLSIEQLDLSGAPAFRRRELMAGYARFWAPPRRAEWNTWTRRTRQGDQFNAVFGHAWAHVIPPDLYFKAHPEWFSLVNGKRIPAQLCISNPALRDEFTKRLLSLPGNKKLDIISVSANDGYGFCECDNCRAKGDIGDSYWDFVNDIAQRVKKLRPDVGIGTFAYSFSRQPPKKIDRLPDNVYLSMTSYATQLMLPDGQKEYREFTDGWKSKGVKIVMREYWGVHYWLDLPVVYPLEIAQEIKMGYAAGMIGVYGETGKNFSTQAPNYYVLTHQLWNPQADPQKTLEEFYAAFGPAGPSVRAYYDAFSDAVHRTWRQKQLKSGYNQLVNTYGEMFDPDTLKKAGADLDAADRSAGDDAPLKARLAFIRSGYNYTVLMAELLGLYSKLGRSGFPLEHFEWQATAQLPRRVFHNPDFNDGRDYFESRLKEPFKYTIAEQDQWLKRAWVLGQKRIQMLNAARSDFSLNEGLYAQTLEANIRQWQQTIAHYLGKPESDIIPLDYSHPAKKSPKPAKKPAT
jgi:hypothetical protein